RFRKIPQAKDFYSPSRVSDVVFIVEGEKMYASKKILAHSSPYFEKMFFGDLDKSQEKEFEITLEMIYDIRRMFDDDNVELLLKMADKYEIMGFRDRAEKWLGRALKPDDHMNMNRPKYTELPMHMKLRLADQYKLDLLKEHILHGLGYFDDVIEIKRSDSYEHYSRELVDEWRS
ncbi:hypothetical protein PENTCL1PPCAC_23546, partial [Pristionchus entomophagus]